MLFGHSNGQQLPPAAASILTATSDNIQKQLFAIWHPFIRKAEGQRECDVRMLGVTVDMIQTYIKQCLNTL